MESWMLLQGLGFGGAALSMIGAVVAFRKKKTPAGIGALILAAGLAFVGLNATAFTTDSVEAAAADDGLEGSLEDDDFDAPL